jgi:hypothetical protein
MAADKKGRRKTFFTTSNPGEIHQKNVSGGKFTKKTRKHKAKIVDHG